MKKIIILIIIYCSVASLVFAQQTAVTITIKGDIIDNLCVSSKKPEELAGFLRIHTKECALRPQCIASGYSIFSDGKLMKFDQISNFDIESFLKMPLSKLQVIVECEKSGNLLRLMYIENQK